MSNYEEATALARELSELLKVDYGELLYYICLLMNLPSGHSQKAENDGLVIRDHSGKVVPLHPRMAISNLYRVSLSKSPEIKFNRQHIDDIIAKLISISVH